MKPESEVKIMLGIERERLKLATTPERLVIENRISILNWVLDRENENTTNLNFDQYPDNEAGGIVFCGKCGHKK